ncbi:CBS domain-containing protein [Longispora albida]|uniref:CBS domain-containing protein n=1 Tax=Longispora albida TaxID=203523 RepID=UPI000362703D|nr:CBS domain-containing protein [Longispora albida]
MAELVRSMMTRHPVCLPGTTRLADAARAMRDHDIGDVLVVDEGRLTGIVTDRDLIVRGIAEGMGPEVMIGELATDHPSVLGPEDPVDYAVRLMTQHRVRRLPVCEDGGRPVGIVSLGDLAVEREPKSALGTISAAEPTK